MDAMVAILCNDLELQFPIDDVTPDILKDSFDLDTEPKLLYQCDSKIVITYKKWQSHLTPGCSYYLKSNNASSSKYIQKDESLGELILNSVVASATVYYMSHNTEDEQMCHKYLFCQLENHNFEYVIQSKYGENVYIIAKELNMKRIYIAFRGTQELTDWKYNLQADRVACNSSLIPGKFHSGFLQRAQQFPIDKILHDERFKDMDVIVCGHSLGGAIAAIVSIRLQVERKRYKLKGGVKCITFGAPLFGDAMLQKSIDCSNIYHFVCNNDPVPYLLNYTQTLSSVINGLDTKISSLTHQYSSGEGKSYYERNTKGIIETKIRYQQVLSNLTPLVGTVLTLATVVNPGLQWATAMKRIFSIIGDVKSSTATKENVYVPIGNYFFLDDRRQLNKVFRFDDKISISDHIESRLGAHREDMNSNAHAILNYRQLLKTFNQPEIPFGCYPDYLDVASAEYICPEPRTIECICPYTPVIHSVQLTTVENRETTILRLRLTGLHLFEVVLPMCQFLFNFPFASSQETTTVKKVSMGESVQRVILEEPFKENVSISDHGTNLIYVTQFGVCEKLIRPNDLRRLVNQSVEQIARHDSVALVVRRAVQRGMALSKIKMASGSSSLNIIIEEIKELGNIALGHEAMEPVQTMFDENLKDFTFILSNEDAFQQVKVFSDKIENYLRSPMEIEAEWSILQKIVFGLTVAAGTATVGYLAGAGLVIIGVASAVSPASAAVGGMFGCLAAGASANKFLTDKLTDSAYQNALKWINQQLLEAKEVFLPEKTALQILDLQDDGGIYSHEKILMLLINKNSLKVEFDKSSLSKCSAKSKEVVRRRIKAIQRIHSIRDIFSRQCFIGVVGLQDAGKTTLLKKIWGVGGKTGFFTHTDVPLLYEITPRLLVVDFPGSNSLDYHAKTFSICGAMNNLVIVVIPFTGDISRVVSDEMINVFSVMRGSGSTKVIMCVNKCGLHLERLRDELRAMEDPVDFLKKRFIDKLNEHYENCGMGISIKKDNILFTDWERGEEEEL